MDKIISATQAAQILGLTPRRVRVLCEQGRIDGAQKVGHSWIMTESSISALERKPAGRPYPK